MPNTSPLSGRWRPCGTQGLVTGQQDVTVYPDGSKILSFVCSSTDHRAQRCCIWSIANGNEAMGEAPPATA